MSGPVRAPAVAGLFYPADPAELEDLVRTLLARAEPRDTERPRAFIAPHAGYVYSGPIAASAYRLTPPDVRRVLLLGPSHRYPLEGLAAPSAQAFATPLGDLAVDVEAVESLLDLPGVHRIDAAHAGEHSLEVHLPFLQVALEGAPVRITPLVVGEAQPEQVREVIERWERADGGGLIIVSSDLSHYLPYETGRELDIETARAIESLRPEAIGPHQACGCRPIAGLLLHARERGLRARLLDLRSSGDTAGDRDRVVGYCSFTFR